MCIPSRFRMFVHQPYPTTHWGQAHKRSEEVVSLQKEKQEDSDLASVIQ